MRSWHRLRTAFFVGVPLVERNSLTKRATMGSTVKKAANDGEGTLHRSPDLFDFLSPP